MNSTPLQGPGNNTINRVRPEFGVGSFPLAPTPAKDIPPDDSQDKPHGAPARTPPAAKASKSKVSDLETFYSPAGGNARSAGPPQRYSDPNDPRRYRGPLNMFG
jgi:hypothetical protein